MIPRLPAHGIPVPDDPPLPPAAAVTAAVTALLISFVVLARWWRSPRSSGEYRGRPVPPRVQGLVDSPGFRTGARALTLVAAVLVCAVGLAGPGSSRDNLAPTVVYAVFWVGLVPASLLLGPVWRVVNPLRLLHAGLARMLRFDPEAGLVALPEAGRYYPAAVSLMAFGWMELVYPDGDDPAVVAGFLLGYAGLHSAAALVFGRRWFDYGDGFEVYSTLLGSMAPLGRRADGVLVRRSPLDGLAAIRPHPGLTVVLLALVGTTAYDGLSAGTGWWQDVNSAIDVVDATYLPALDVLDGTQGLLLAILLVAGIYLLGTVRLGTRHGFAHTLVPIAAGYLLAHYISQLVLGGQRVAILASDPFGTGTDLLTTADATVDYSLVGALALALVQVGAITVGHLVAAVSAHDRAAALLGPGTAVRAQYPLVAAMVLLTVGAVTVLAEG